MSQVSDVLVLVFQVTHLLFQWEKQFRERHCSDKVLLKLCHEGDHRPTGDPLTFLGITTKRYYAHWFVTRISRFLWDKELERMNLRPHPALGEADVCELFDYLWMTESREQMEAFHKLIGQSKIRRFGGSKFEVEMSRAFMATQVLIPFFASIESRLAAVLHVHQPFRAFC
jgi:hypothetical protein